MIVSIWILNVRDEKYIVVSMESTVSSEMRYAPADLSKGFTVLAGRERDVKYWGDHFDSRWVMRTNADGAKITSWSLHPVMRLCVASGAIGSCTIQQSLLRILSCSTVLLRSKSVLRA